MIEHRDDDVATVDDDALEALHMGTVAWLHERVMCVLLYKSFDWEKIET